MLAFTQLYFQIFGSNCGIHPISWEFVWPYMLVALTAGYLLGSIPFGMVLTKLAGLGDIRNIGSGNIGATNVLRTGRKGLAALTLVLDLAKGAGATLLGGLYGPDVMIVTAIGAIIGHIYPIWIGFRGGKGVATGLGIIFGLTWQAALLAVFIWLLVALVTRYSSLAALIASLLLPLLTYWLSPPQIMEFTILLTVIIWLRHVSNIKRLLNGSEARIGDTK